MPYIKQHGKIILVGEPVSKVTTKMPDEEFVKAMTAELEISAEILSYGLNDFFRTYCRYKRILSKRKMSLMPLEKYTLSLFKLVRFLFINRKGLDYEK